MLLNTKKLKSLVARLVAIFIAAVLFFALCYWALGCFEGHGIKISAEPKCTPSLQDYLYFSVVTLTTLGYGDIVPIGHAKTVASMEAVFGLVFFGYSISQIVSFRQEGLIDYLTNSQIIQTYDECLADVAEAKEMIGDRRRALQAKLQIEASDYVYFRLNPFYPLFRAIKTVVGYTAHVENIGKIFDLQSRVELAAHHIEEAAGFARKLLNILDMSGLKWKTDRTVMILTELCEVTESFQHRFIKYTKYDQTPYKGGNMYSAVIDRTLTDIRKKIAGPTEKYKANSGQTSKVRRISRHAPPSAGGTLPRR